MLATYMEELYIIKIKMYVALETVENVAEEIAGSVVVEKKIVVDPIFEIKPTFVEFKKERLHVV